MCESFSRCIVDKSRIPQDEYALISYKVAYKFTYIQMNFIQHFSLHLNGFGRLNKKKEADGPPFSIVCLSESVRLDELQGVWTAIRHQHQAVHASLCPTQIECGAECA